MYTLIQWQKTNNTKYKQTIVNYRVAEPILSKTFGPSFVLFLSLFKF